MDISWDYSRPFLQTLVVKENDIDALGHTNNQVYGRWCEQLAWEHSAFLGLDASDYQSLQKALVIREAKYQYLTASFAGDNLLAATWITACDGKLNLEREFQFNNSVTGECLFRAKWKLVSINLETGKPCRMPEKFVNCYSPQVVND